MREPQRNNLDKRGMKSHIRKVLRACGYLRVEATEGSGAYADLTAPRTWAGNHMSEWAKRAGKAIDQTTHSPNASTNQ